VKFKGSQIRTQRPGDLLPRGILLNLRPIVGFGVILFVAIIYKVVDWRSEEPRQSPLPNENVAVRGQGRGARSHGKANLTADFFRLMNEENLSRIGESQIRFSDGNGDRIPLSAIKTPTGEVSRIASSAAPRGRSRIDFEGFFDQVANHGEGLSMLNAAEIPTHQLSRIDDILKKASLMLSADDEFDLLPLEILDHDGGRKSAWLLTVRSANKVSLLEDGVPSGVSADESIMRYKRQWYLLPSDSSQGVPILFNGYTFEE
jgi:hypothetical protein